MKAVLALLWILPLHGLHVVKSSDDTKMKSCLNTYANGLDGIKPGLSQWVRDLEFPKDMKTDDRKIMFGAGSGTTGTRSLHSGLQLLGANGVHYGNQQGTDPSKGWCSKLRSTFFAQIDDGHTSEQKRQCHKKLQKFDYTSLPKGIEYVLDSPTDQVFLHLFKTFPNAKFLLSKRPARQWAVSRAEHGPLTPVPLLEPCGEHFHDYKLSEAAKMLELKDEVIKCIVPQERLMEVDVFTDSKARMNNIMDELGNFVGHPLQSSKSPELSRRLPGTKLHEVKAQPKVEGGYEKKTSKTIQEGKMYLVKDLGFEMRQLAHNGRELLWDRK